MLSARSPKRGKWAPPWNFLTVVLGSGGAGAVLARSIFAWLTQRRSEVSVSLKDADGHEFQFTSKATKQDPADVFREASALFTALRDNTSVQEQADR